MNADRKGLVHAAALAETDRAALLRHVAAAERIQPGPGDRLVVFFYAPDPELPRFSCTDEAHQFAGVKIRGCGRAVWATVEAHKGRLFSIASHGSPKQLGTRAFVVDEVASDRVAPDIATAVDRLEHGRRGGRTGATGKAAA